MVLSQLFTIAAIANNCYQKPRLENVFLVKISVQLVLNAPNPKKVLNTLFLPIRMFTDHFIPYEKQMFVIDLFSLVQKTDNVF